MKKTTAEAGWQESKTEVFWGEIAPSDHVVQIYENNSVFLDALAGFVGGGINSGDCCIVIATGVHLKELEDRRCNYGIQVHDLVTEKTYFPPDAEETLSKFMVNNWPDEILFNKTVDEILTNCSPKRKIRAFGEMVALLWAQGHSGATVQLEHLWNKYCEKKTFCLFCAYPHSGFTRNIEDSIQHVCGTHSKMISGNQKQLTEVFYKDLKIA
jgi:hypothetical protein